MLTWGRFVDTDMKNHFAAICDAAQDAQHPNDCLQLLVEDIDSQGQKIWQLRWKPGRVRQLKPASEVSFHKLLMTQGKPSLLVRRQLALVFAFSLFQLHESPWVSSQWDKDRIHFFHTDQGDLDFQKPYLSTSFDALSTGADMPDPHCFHPNLGILRLGLFLIEVHMWRPIESLRQQTDLMNGVPTPNTDSQVAERTLNTMNDCYPTYLGAIQACLDANWASAGSRISLEDVDTWNGVFKDVIVPLESETKLAGASFDELCRLVSMMM